MKKKFLKKNQYLNDEIENLKNNFELKIQKLTNQIEQQNNKLEQQNNKIEQQKYQLEKQRKEFKFKLNIVNEDNYRLKLSLKNQMEEIQLGIIHQLQLLPSLDSLIFS